MGGIKKQQEQRRGQLQHTLRLLVHASVCDQDNCTFDPVSNNCTKLRQLFDHAKTCTGAGVEGWCKQCRYACMRVSL